MQWTEVVSCITIFSWVSHALLKAENKTQPILIQIIHRQACFSSLYNYLQVFAGT
uniref:Uncharacterized protein n=1 Tax=Rhizophora mucronata TaxID=61149 RepID=A0A2P2IHX8_RHIMU